MSRAERNAPPRRDYRWILAYREKVGGKPTDAHRFFRCNDPGPDFGRIGVADNSGHRPEDTDDGVLWLDVSGKRCIEIELAGGYKNRGRAHIPLLRDDNGLEDDEESLRSWTGESAVAGLEIAALFGLRVEFSAETRRFLDAHAAWKAKQDGKEEVEEQRCPSCGAGPEPELEKRCWKCDEFLGGKK